MKLKVYPDASLEVVAPPGMDERLIRRFVEDNRQWVDGVRARLLANAKRGPEAGAFPTVLVLRSLDLMAEVSYVPAGRKFCQWHGPALKIGLPQREPAAAHAALVAALKVCAAEHLAPRFHALAERHVKAFGRLTWRNQKSRWGSCSSNGNISLNVRLLFLPSRLVEYVWVHELAHLDHPDHSPRFWRAVETMLPGARQRQGEMRRANALLPDWLLASV